MFEEDGPPAPLRTNHRVAVGSGKGGVGKTLVAANLAVALGQRGERVLLVDLDLFHPNQHVVFGLEPRVSVLGLLRSEDLAGVACGTASGVDVLAGRSGITPGVTTRSLLERLLERVDELGRGYDRVVFDLAPGVGDDVLPVALEYLDTLVVVGGTDSLSLTDAYAFAKVALTARPELDARLVLNRCASEETHRRCAERFDAACRRFLGRSFETLGWIPYSRRLARSPRGVEIVVGPTAPTAAGRALFELAGQLAPPPASEADAAAEPEGGEGELPELPAEALLAPPGPLA